MQKNDYKKIIIGIDHGFKNMKTKECIFPTALTKLENMPDDPTGVLQFNGRYYKENGEPLSYVDNTDKTKTNDFYILTLIAIAKEMSKRGLEGARIILAAGLPQRWYDRQKPEFEKYLGKYRELNFYYEGRLFHVWIDDVMVYTQGYAAFMSSDQAFEYMNQECCLVDIGGGTVDMIRIVNGSVMSGMEGSKIDTKASLWLINQVMEQVEAELCTTIPESSIIRYMQTGSKEADPANTYERIMQTIFRGYSDMIFSNLKKNRINTDLIPVFFMGGGSLVIQNFGSYDNTGNIKFITDIHANAKGYEYIAEIFGEE